MKARVVSPKAVVSAIAQESAAFLPSSASQPQPLTPTEPGGPSAVEVSDSAASLPRLESPPRTRKLSPGQERFAWLRAAAASGVIDFFHLISH